MVIKTVLRNDSSHFHFHIFYPPSRHVADLGDNGDIQANDEM